VTSTQREDKLVQYSAELTQANISNKVVPKLCANETTGTEKVKLVFRSPENLSRLLVYFASFLKSIQRVVMGSWLCRLPPGFPGRSREYWSKSAGILGARAASPDRNFEFEVWAQIQRDTRTFRTPQKVMPYQLFSAVAATDLSG
jgi:hypothetical protein